MHRIPRHEYSSLVAGIAQDILLRPPFLGVLEALETRVPIREAFWPEALALTLAAARVALETLPAPVADLDAVFKEVTPLLLDATLNPNTPSEVKAHAGVSLEARAKEYRVALKSEQPSLSVWHLFREATGAAEFLDTAQLGSLIVPLVATLKTAYAEIRVA